VRATDSLAVNFSLTDGKASIDVTYTGLFNATEVLAKHDEQYIPPEVAEAMAQASEASGTEHQETCNKI